MKKFRFSESQIVGILKEVEVSAKVITFIQAHMALNPRHGFGLLYDSACHQGKPWGKTMLWRVYRELRLNLPRRGKKQPSTERIDGQALQARKSQSTRESLSDDRQPKTTRGR